MTGPEIRLEVRSDPKLLRSIRGLLRCYVTTLGFTDECADKIVLAVDEACTNAIRHAYQGDTDCEFELGLKSNDDHVEITLTDNGRPAPPECLIKRELETPDPDTVTPGGLGIQLIHTVFDQVTFEQGEEGGNKVIMRLKRPDRRPGGG